MSLILFDRYQVDGILVPLYVLLTTSNFCLLCTSYFFGVRMSQISRNFQIDATHATLIFRGETNGISFNNSLTSYLEHQLSSNTTPAEEKKKKILKLFRPKISSKRVRRKKEGNIQTPRRDLFQLKPK